MRGYEVIFKFLMISFKTPIESQFSQDPLHHFPYFSSPTLWIPPVFGIMERYFQGLFRREGYVAHGPFSTGNVSIYQITATNTYCQYISTLSKITPIWTFPPSTIQVL